MGTEIERKFLVTDLAWRGGARTETCRQGYILAGPPVSVRVRIMDGRATLNLKKGDDALSREEYEFPIPLADASQILDGLCSGYPIEKTRHYVEFEGMTWEIDAFSGVNAGLTVAEIELESEDQTFAIPPWAGKEVTHDPKYLNARLSEHPYTHW